MKSGFRVLGWMLPWAWLSFYAGPAWALEEEFTGLVIDQTISKFGHDFYEYFIAEWEPPDDSSILTIRERPGAILGSVISVEIDDTVVFEDRLTPLASTTEEKAQDARNFALEFINTRGKALQELDLY